MDLMKKKLAFVFPGQGSQSVGMLSNLAVKFPIVKNTFSDASAVLGYDLWKIVSEGSEIELNKTIHTQPALLASDIAMWKIWQATGDDMPIVMAGHSLGEYAAWVASEAIDFLDVIRLVAKRAQLMQEAVPAGQGAMAVILGLSEEQVLSICEKAAFGQVVEAVNFNSPVQVVIAGIAEAVDRAIALAKENGAKRAKLLPVSIPSHCLLMKEAAHKFSKCLADTAIYQPKIPVINNVDVAVNSNPDDIRDALERQFYNPVRWIETINMMAEFGVNTVIECGSGKVLTGLNKRINVGLEYKSLSSEL